MRRSLSVLALIGVVLASTTAVAQSGGHVMVAPADIKWADAPPVLPPGAKIAVIEGVPANPGPFTFRLKLPANYKVAPHSHPAIEHVTVITGSFPIGMGEKFDAEKVKPLPVGSFVAIEPNTPHFVLTKKETIIQVHGVGPWGLTYVNPADDPRKK